MLCVEADQVKLFHGVCAELRQEKPGSLRGSRESGPPRRSPRQRSTTEFDGRENLRGFHSTDARHGTEFIGAKAGQVMETARMGQPTPNHVLDVSPLSPAANDQCQEFGVCESGETHPDQSLAAGSVVMGRHAWCACKTRAHPGLAAGSPYVQNLRI